MNNTVSDNSGAAELALILIYFVTFEYCRTVNKIINLMHSCKEMFAFCVYLIVF